VRPALDRSDGHSVVLKNADVVTGLSDLPWHRDCGLGGHPVTCPTLNIGIQLDAARAASGRLHFLAGSHRGSVHRSMLAQPDLPIMAVDTEPGDVTVHIGDVLHAAPPPEGTGPGRRALYLTFMPPRAFDVIGPGASYNDVIRLGAARAR
jgi:ectoine hydroxylase-related dioxygenase (phytanoyl-CoA dioxygenase family)